MELKQSNDPNQSWRCVLPPHSAAELLPRMSDAALKELGADIKAHGQQVPIVIFTDTEGKRWLLDGISRLKGMQLIGLQVIKNGALNADVVQFQEINDVDPVAYVLSANLHRRHLSIKDKRALAGNLLEMFPNKSDRQIAEMVGLSHNTVKVIRREMEGTGQIDQCAVRIGKDKRKQPATKPPKPTSAAETDPIHAGGEEVDQAGVEIDHRHGEHDQLANHAGERAGVASEPKSAKSKSTPPPKDPPKQSASEKALAEIKCGTRHYFPKMTPADRRAALEDMAAAATMVNPTAVLGVTLDLPGIDKLAESKMMPGALIAIAFNQLCAKGVGDFLTHISPAHQRELKQHFAEPNFENEKAEIAKVAAQGRALAAHPLHNEDSIKAHFTRIIRIALPDQKLHGAKTVAEKSNVPLNTTLAHDAIEAANEAIAASWTTKH